MMKPTVGRVVYFHEHESQPQPYAAIITYVHTDMVVNLVIFDANGNPMPRASVPLSSSVSHTHYVWSWMPYQLAKAAAGDHNSESAEPRPDTAAGMMPAQ